MCVPPIEDAYWSDAALHCYCSGYTFKDCSDCSQGKYASVILGKGSFGTVLRAVFQGTPVAIKRMNREGSAEAREKLEQSFAREVKALQTIRHPNVVLLMGKTISRTIILELLELGSLCKFIRNHRPSSVVEHSSHKGLDKTLFGMVLDTARGLAFTHAQGFCHGDIKSSNVLISKSMNAKLSDFGHATICSEPMLLMNAKGVHKRDPVEEGSTRKGEGPTDGSVVHGSAENEIQQTFSVPNLKNFHPNFSVAWAAPERLADTTTPGSQGADVYSFGILMWEVLFRQLPYEHLSNESLYTVAKKVAEEGMRPEVVSGHLAGPLLPVTQEYIDLMKLCWNHHPHRRPSSSFVLLRLEKMHEKVFAIDVPSLEVKGPSEQSKENQVHSSN